MNFVNEVKGLISRGEVREASANLLEDAVNAVLGDLVSAGKLMKAIYQSPFFIREQLFWSKMEMFLDGAYLSEDDCANLRAKLTECGEKGDNPRRLLECIDKIETKQKIRYLINATRCLLASFIDRPDYFRICDAITRTLDEDLIFLRDHIKEADLPYSNNVQGLLTAGLMHQSVLDANGNQKYSFIPFAEIVDRFAVSYDNDARYPNPTDISSTNRVPEITIPALDGLEDVLSEI